MIPFWTQHPSLLFLHDAPQDQITFLLTLSLTQGCCTGESESGHRFHRSASRTRICSRSPRRHLAWPDLGFSTCSDLCSTTGEDDTDKEILVRPGWNLPQTPELFHVQQSYRSNDDADFAVQKHFMFVIYLLFQTQCGKCACVRASTYHVAPKTNLPFQRRTLSHQEEVPSWFYRSTGCRGDCTTAVCTGQMCETETEKQKIRCWSRTAGVWNWR